MRSILKRFTTYGALDLASKAALAFVLSFATPALAQERVILALGDSLTQGFGLPEAEGFVPQLAAYLAQQGHSVQVINGGVSGDTTAGGLARVEWSLTPEVAAMIVALGGNDLLRGIDPALVRSNIEGILQIAQARGLPVLLIGMEAPGNYGATYKADFDALYPELAKAYGALHMGSFFEGMRAVGEGPADLAPYMQADGIHPNAKGVVQVLTAIGPKVEALLDLDEAAE